MKKTFLVVGPAKSGTSMAAGLLRLAGVSFGTDDELREYDPQSENIYLIERLRSGCPHVIPEFNARYDVWGVKHPMLAGDLPRLLQSCRNPHFVFCYRDPFAIAQHKRKNDRNGFNQTTYARTMLDDLKTIETMTQFIAAQRPSPLPVLMLSYEKAIAYPNTAAEQVITFTGLDVTHAQRMRMVDWIRPGQGYRSVRELEGTA